MSGLLLVSNENHKSFLVLVENQKHVFHRPNNHQFYIPQTQYSLLSRFDIVDVPFQILLNEEWSKGLEDLIIIYDSACRFKCNAYARCTSNPHSPLDQQFWPRLKPNSDFLKFYVNTFHQHSHIPECADVHSLQNSSQIGMVTGEEIETGWATLNHLQYSIREMDAGARVDMITAHMLKINKDKIRRMGESSNLRRRNPTEMIRKSFNGSSLQCCSGI